MTAELVTARFAEAWPLPPAGEIAFFSPPLLPRFSSRLFLRPSACFLKWHSSCLCPFLAQYPHCISVVVFVAVAPPEVPGPPPEVPRPVPRPPRPPRPLPRRPPGLVTAKALLAEAELEPVPVCSACMFRSDFSTVASVGFPASVRWRIWDFQVAGRPRGCTGSHGV